MAARIKVTTGSNGRQEFMFISQDGGHGDLIGGVKEFDNFLHSAMGLAATEGTPLGQLIVQAEYNTTWMAATGRLH